MHRLKTSNVEAPRGLDLIGLPVALERGPELGPGERSQANRPDELVWPLAEHSEEADDLVVAVVVDLDEGALLAEEHARRAAERFDV